MRKIILTFIIIGSFSAYAGNPDKNFILKKANPTMLNDNDEKKLSIGVAVGLSVPMQEYHSTTSSTDTTRVVGYAKTGFHYNVTLAYKFSKYVGGMLMVSGNINAVNTTAATTDLLGNSGASGLPSTGSIKASGFHYVGQYLIGPYLSVPLAKKISVEVRALVGLANAAYPRLTGSSSSSYSYYGYSFSYSASIDRKINGGVGFGYNFGIGAKYMLGEHLAATLFVDYAGSSMSYNGYNSTYSFSETIGQGTPQSYSSTTNSKTSLKMSIGMLNVSAGVTYSF